VAGGFDYLVKARVADMTAYRRFLGESLLALRGCGRHGPMRSWKRSSATPAAGRLGVAISVMAGLETRPSTPFLRVTAKNVDARDKPGNDGRLLSGQIRDSDENAPEQK